MGTTCFQGCVLSSSMILKPHRKDAVWTERHTGTRGRGEEWTAHTLQYSS